MSLVLEERANADAGRRRKVSAGGARTSIMLDGRRVDYLIRRNPRSRDLRAVIDPRLGLVISVPPSTRRGWADPAPVIDRFLGERRGWVVRHLDRLERDLAERDALGRVSNGGSVMYLGVPHRVRPAALPAGTRRSTVERSGGEDGDELIVRVAPRERRSIERILEAWFRDRARVAIEAAIARHAGVMGVRPSIVDLRDPRTRWGSASKHGRLMFSWRLILATPDALETVVVHELSHLKVFGHGPRFWSIVASRRPTHLADRAWLRRRSFALHAALGAADALEPAV